MDARGLSYGIAVGATAATGYVAWRVARSRLLTLLVGAIVSMRLGELMRARQAQRLPPSPPGADLIAGLRDAYHAGTARWANAR